MTSLGRNLAVADSAEVEAEFERFETAWKSGSPPSIDQFLSDASGSEEMRDSEKRQLLLVEIVAIDLERRWRSKSACAWSTVKTGQAGTRELPPKPRLEDYAHRFPALVGGGEMPIDLIVHEYRVRVLWGDRPSISEFLTRFPAQADAVRRELTRIRRETPDSDVTTDQPLPQSEDDVPRHDTSTVGAADVVLADSQQQAPPERIGRFEVKGVLGSGTFGVVYQANDPQLKREVAIKIPRPGCVAALGGASGYLAEARNIASLDHAGIVPVYEVGCSDDGQCYVVSKLMTGGDLERLTLDTHLPYERSAELVACVADALHHAHGRGLVHRDVKPANILLDAEGNPLLADFGLALHENDFGSGPGYVGTPTYMSPEQARVEGHLVDARSDIFSLGLVLFKLLSGKSPYRSKSMDQLVAEITSCEPRPVRQLDPLVPEELDRICQKARATRPADRYSTASDLAQDLRAFLRQRQKPSAPRRVLTLALIAIAACALVALGVALFSEKNAAPVAALAPPAPLDAPFLDMDHLVTDESGRRPVTVTKRDIPLSEGEEVVLDVRLRSKQVGFLYLFQFDEGRPARRLWPTDLARQEKVNELRYPAEGRGIPLTGEPRRILILAAVSPTPLGESDLKAIESTSFSLARDLTPQQPLREFVFPADPQRPVLRGQTPVVQLDPVRLSANPERELQKHFDAFSALAFYYGATEPE
jgi:serine/threonine protein kinase